MADCSVLVEAVFAYMCITTVAAVLPNDKAEVCAADACHPLTPNIVMK